MSMISSRRMAWGSLEVDEKAAVDKERGAGDIAGEVGSEEHHDVGNVFRLAKPAERHAAVEIGALLGVGPIVAVNIRLDGAGHHRIAADLVRAEGDRDRLHE